MTTNKSPLVMLDLHDEYQQFEQTFDSELFRRFTDKTEFLAHISSRPANVRTWHYFIPESEQTIVGSHITFSNTIYYIYCLNQQSINEMNQRYPFPTFVRSFHVDSLLMNLQGAGLTHRIDQANRTQHQPDEHDVALQAAIELSSALGDEFREHMIFKTGMQPDD